MLILAFTLSVVLMILLPVLIAALLHRRFQVPWFLFCAGTLTFIASQVVHIPLNNLLMFLHLLPKTGVSDSSITLLQSSVILGLTAGLCEESARWVGYRLLRRYRGLEDGLMIGLGHGGVEAMIFGGVLTAATVSSLVPLIGSDLAKLNLTPDQLNALTIQLNALSGMPFLAAASPLLERLLAMLIHVTLSLMVLQAFRRRNLFYYAAAVLYHMAFDAVAVYVSTQVSNHTQLYLFLVGMLIPGVIWLVLLWRKEAQPVKRNADPVGFELGVLATAVRKELIQQWRTRRVLVVMAVFVLFGLTSPLVARYTPEIFKSIPGAEQFAGLIPKPTATDAMSQYIKNITQFGFLLAVLLGMNAVAGEKETGTAAMILSKPMPRWAFIVSKFAGQALVYASAFLVAGLGAYTYTWILFGSFSAGVFTAINLLLLLWLLVYVAAALLGSVIGSTVAAAAGFGLGISVVLLLAGNIPQYGQLFPSGLMGWASLLGANTAQIPANGGAVAGAGVLIVLCLLWAVALFERQEI
jgi:ABC-2 type transport system permease protein